METKHRFTWMVPVFLIVLAGIPFLVGGIVSFEQEVSGTPSIDSTITVVDSGEESLVLPLERGDTEGSAHVDLPDEVRGIYWTAVTARSARGDELLEYMKETGLNTVVIDAQLDDGTIVDIEEFVPMLSELAEANIYRIARIAVMRNGEMARIWPNVALRTAGGGYWYDSIGSIWVDPAAPIVAQEVIELGEALYELGFDEIQYDYVRFASDGAVNAIVYPVYDGIESKVDVMQRFFKTVGGAMQEKGIPVSFDLFGMTYWSYNDYNIGQRLVDVLPYADYISPMVYPSHYPDGFKGLANPAEHPYEIVKMSLDEGLRLTRGLCACSDEELAARSRPWLQDFDIGAVYTAELIEAQIQAARDAGASGWILWNARNVYEPADYR